MECQTEPRSPKAIGESLNACARICISGMASPASRLDLRRWRIAWNGVETRDRNRNRQFVAIILLLVGSIITMSIDIASHHRDEPTPHSSRF